MVTLLALVIADFTAEIIGITQWPMKKATEQSGMKLQQKHGTGGIQMDKIASKIVPTMFAIFKQWVNEEMFLAICNGKEILCHKDYWHEI